MNDQTHEVLSGVAVALFLIITIIGPYIYDAAMAEPEPIKPIHISVPEPHLTVPDVSFAFEVEANREKAAKVLEEAIKRKAIMDTVMLPTVEVKKTNLGTYYITGYTSVECGGSTMTASGSTCHKAASYEDSFYNPTTCAIDPALHDFGDFFFIEGFGCYVAEDTGSAVKGKHLDLYFWDDEYGYALSITGYYTVYSIEFIYGEVPATNYDIHKLVADKVIGWKIAGT